MSISVMIDLAIAAALILFAYLGWKRGLIRSLLGLVTVAAAVILSTQIAKAAAPEIIDRYLRPAAYEAIEVRIEEIGVNGVTDVFPLDGAVELVEAIPNQFIRDHALALLDTVEDRVPAVNVKEAALGLARETVDEVLNSVVRDVVQSILCAVLFAVISFALRIVTKALRIAEKLPGIRQLNRLGGLLLGAAKGLLVVCVCVWALRLAGVITPEIAGNSLLLSAFSALAAGV